MKYCSGKRYLSADADTRRPKATPRKMLLELNDDVTVDQKERLWVRIVTVAERATPLYGKLLSEVLELQSQRVWRTDMTVQEQARGFLATTWSPLELRALMDEGAWLVVAVDKETGQLQGYGLVAPVSHLPAGNFVPRVDSPIRTCAELRDETRFMYGYQIAVRPERTLRHIQISAVIIDAMVAENCRRGVNVVTCVLEAPVCNKRSLAFLSAMGLRRIGDIYDPIGGRAVWACMIKLPLRAPTVMK